MSTKTRHPDPSPDRLCTTNCGRPVFDTNTLCAGCGDDLWEHLVKVAEPGCDGHGHTGRTLVDELNATITGQARIAARNIGVNARSASTPLPWNEHASQALAHLHDILSGWVHTIAGYNGLAVDVLTEPVPAADWLLRHHRRLRQYEYAAFAYQEIIEAVRRAEYAIDRPADRRYAGPCEPECGGEVYGRPGHIFGRCDVCGVQYDIEERRQWLLDKAQDYLVTAAEASKALPSLLDRPLNVKTIRTWMNTGRLSAVSSPDGPLHRLGDIVDLAVVTRMRNRGPSQPADREVLLDTPA